jgi:Fur family ferric uptake transcriptional regulator
MMSLTMIVKLIFGLRQEPIMDAILVFNDYLRQRNLSLTRQRKDILKAFLEAKQHITAEQLAETVKVANPGVGLSTVYRTLKLLVESQLAEEHHFAGGVTLYEAVLNHHEHMICLDCQLIIEFENEELEALKERIASDHGFKMIRHSLHLYGLCRSCQEVPSRALVHV